MNKLKKIKNKRKDKNLQLWIMSKLDDNGYLKINTLCSAAIDEGNIDILKILIRFKYPCGSNELRLCIKNNNVRLMKILLKQEDIKILFMEEYQNMLNYAQLNNSIRCIREILTYLDNSFARFDRRTLEHKSITRFDRIVRNPPIALNRRASGCKYPCIRLTGRTIQLNNNYTRCN